MKLALEEKKAREKGPPKILDNTMRTTFKACPRKLYWWKIRGADYLVRPPYFSWGTAWHLIKGFWYNSQGCKAEPYSPQWKQDATYALLVGLNHWDNSGSQDTRDDTRANLQRLWKLYVQAYPSEPFRLVKGGAELGWLWPLPLKGGRASAYYLGGSMDGYVSWENFGMLCLEEKTTSIWLSDAFLLQWTFSSQITGYIWYLTQLLGSEAYGALVNMATKKEVKGTGTTSQFERKIETRTFEDLEAFEEDWRRDIEEIEKSWDRWHFPKTVDTINCTGGIGKSACLYKGFCLSGLPPSIIDPLSFPNIALRTEPWEPWHRSSAEIKRGTLKALPTKPLTLKPFKNDLALKLKQRDKTLWKENKR